MRACKFCGHRRDAHKRYLDDTVQCGICKNLGEGPCRGGQPLTVVSYAEASASEGIEYEELGNGMACVSGVCGS